MSDVVMFLIGVIGVLALCFVIGEIIDRRAARKLARQIAEMSKWRRP